MNPGNLVHCNIEENIQNDDDKKFLEFEEQEFQVRIDCTLYLSCYRWIYEDYTKHQNFQLLKQVLLMSVTIYPTHMEKR